MVLVVTTEKIFFTLVIWVSGLEDNLPLPLSIRSNTSILLANRTM